MTAPNLPVVKLDLPLPAAVPTRAFDDLAQRLGQVSASLYRHTYQPKYELREAIPAAEALLAECADQADQLRSAMQPIPRDELKRAVAALLAAWPNAAHADLAGFGAQAMQDLIERRPCRRAVTDGFRRLRHTSRFLPSISEILAAIDEAQRVLRNTSALIGELPKQLEEGRARLAEQDRREAERAQRETEWRDRRAAEGKATGG